VSSLIKHIAHIRTSGTIVRSSPYLINRLLRSIDFAAARTIVQLGAGTGCITRAVLKRLRPDARLIVLELNEAFIDECRDIRDRRLTMLHACATTLPHVITELGLTRVDHVVSSLPLAIMDEALVEQILEVSQAALAPGGMFLQYQYSLKHHAALVKRYEDVQLGFTLVNIPPAFVYECTQGARVAVAGD
jgi:phospholipid N-methyltransferase